MALGMFAISALAFNNIIGISTLVFIIIYTASFMMSWGPICWVLISEIFPNKIRGQAVAVAVAFQWFANYLISSTYPAMMEFSGGMTYGFYGLMALLSALFVWKDGSETKGNRWRRWKVWAKKKIITKYWYSFKKLLSLHPQIRGCICISLFGKRSSGPANNEYSCIAQMAELVDALVSGTSVGYNVQVRVLFWAPFAQVVKLVYTLL